MLAQQLHARELGATTWAAEAAAMVQALETRPIPAGHSKAVAKSTDSVP